MSTQVSPPWPAHAARRLAAMALELIPVIERAVLNGEPADAALNGYFRAHKYHGARDRRFLGDAVFSYFRWKGWLPGDLPTACGLAWQLDAAVPHPAGDQLAAQAGLPVQGFEPLGDRTLEEKASAVTALTGRPASPGALAPDWLPEALAEQAGAPETSGRPALFSACLRAFQQRPPTWLRARPGRRDTVREALERLGLSACSCARIPEALALPGSSPLAKLPPHIHPLFEVQDLSSQCVGLACAPREGERWWDVCAGSGGKSLHLADLMNHRGRILATDIRPDVLRRLRARATRAGCALVDTALADRPGPPAGGEFDGVLVDAPCSGVGTWARQPDARWRTEARVISLCARRQQAILDRAAAGVKSGGVLVYSVCTLTRVETIEQIDGLLRRHPAFRLEPIPHPLRGETTPGTIWIRPWDGPCTGMFIARFRRTA